MKLIPSRPAAGQTWASRGGVAIDTIVVHVMEGSFEGTLDWFAVQTTDLQGNPQNHPIAAAHWCIAKDGRVCGTVAEEFAAWHAGNRAVNARSIGIELEGTTATLAVPEAQMAALAELINDIRARHPLIAADRSHLIGHDEVPDPTNPSMRGGLGHHTDPGLLFSWSDLMARLS